MVDLRAALPVTAFLAGGPSRVNPEFRYPALCAAEPFDRVILSPNGRIGQKGAVDFFAGPTSTELYRLVSWSGPEAFADEGNTTPSPVNVDVLELDRPVRELWVSARFRSEDEDSGIHRLGVTLFRSPEESKGISDKPVGGVGKLSPVALPVEFVSQFAEGSADDASLCCPTSAVMALRFRGVHIDVGEFVQRAFDRRHRIHGNWSLTAAAMSSFGMKAWVQKHTSVAELHSALCCGHPVIASISFGPGELPGAPIERSNGHVLVVRGFDERGDVLVNDPAGRIAAAGQLSYDRSAFARAWLGHGGIAIHAVPEEQET